MRVLLTGATGFTGSYVVPLLLQQGADLRCLVRHSSDTRSLPAERVELAYGDLNDETSLETALRNVEVLVNVASLGFGHAQNIVNAAAAAGVRRAVFISTTAVFTTINARSKSVRLSAEESIHKSGLAYTVLRPAMIYGSSRDRNMCRLIRYIKRWPVIPVFGDGQSLQQPVYVEDVAAAIVQALASPHAVGGSYNLAGSMPLTYEQVIDTVCELTARRVRKIHLPARPVVKGLTFLERLSLRLPVKAEQVMRLNEHKVFDFTEAARDFGYRPRSFAEGIRLELQEMAGYD
jgi:nucleoside-diphosphate-sugar epimerase